MTEIVVALIAVAGSFALAWLQRRWERKNLKNEWQKRAEELELEVKALHEDQVNDLRRQLRAKDRQLTSRDQSRKAKPDDT